MRALKALGCYTASGDARDRQSPHTCKQQQKVSGQFCSTWKAQAVDQEASRSAARNSQLLAGAGAHASGQCLSRALGRCAPRCPDCSARALTLQPVLCARTSPAGLGALGLLRRPTAAPAHASRTLSWSPCAWLAAQACCVRCSQQARPPNIQSRLVCSCSHEPSRPNQPQVHRPCSPLHTLSGS